MSGLRSGSRLCSLTTGFLSPLTLRQLCLLLNAENIFHSMADILLREEDLKFASTMVHTLNTILLTSSELFQLRNQLKDLKTPVWAAGAGSAAEGDEMGVAGTWEPPGDMSCCSVPIWKVQGLEFGWPRQLLRSSTPQELRGVWRTCPTLAFPPPRDGNGLPKPSSSCRLPPSTPTRTRGQVTAGAEPPRSLSCPCWERARGVCQAAATSTSDIQARRGEGGRLLLLLLLLMLKASDAVVSPWVGQPPASRPLS